MINAISDDLHIYDNLIKILEIVNVIKDKSYVK